MKNFNKKGEVYSVTENCYIILMINLNIAFAYQCKIEKVLFWGQIS